MKVSGKMDSSYWGEAGAGGPFPGRLAGAGAISQEESQ